MQNNATLTSPKHFQRPLNACNTQTKMKRNRRRSRAKLNVPGSECCSGAINNHEITFYLALRSHARTHSYTHAHYKNENYTKCTRSNEANVGTYGSRQVRRSLLLASYDVRRAALPAVHVRRERLLAPARASPEIFPCLPRVCGGTCMTLRNENSATPSIASDSGNKTTEKKGLTVQPHVCKVDIKLLNLVVYVYNVLSLLWYTSLVLFSCASRVP